MFREVDSKPRGRQIYPMRHDDPVISWHVLGLSPASPGNSEALGFQKIHSNCRRVSVTCVEFTRQLVGSQNTNTSLGRVPARHQGDGPRHVMCLLLERMTEPTFG